MRLKEIKPGMVIHCKNDDEKKALLEEAERLGYVWYGTKGKPTERSVHGIGCTIHFYDAGKNSFSADYKHITHSCDTGDSVIEFSDLIIPEMTAAEAIQYATEICNETVCSNCPMNLCCFKDVRSDKEKTFEALEKRKSEHEKKEPEIEWFWKSYVVGGSDYKEADTEQEAMEWCEYYAKEHPEAKCTYKHFCRVKAVE